MNLLAIDTTAALCSAAVYDTLSTKLLSATSRDIGRGHAEILIPTINTCLADCGMAFADIGKIAVTAGPGSFTGLRVGLSAARGLALALDVPVVGLSVLDCLYEQASQLGAGRDTITVLDAGRGEVYVRWCESLRDKTKPEECEIMKLEEVAARLEGSNPSLCGAASSALNDVLPKSLPIIHSDAAAQIAIVAYLGAKADPEFARPEPIYLRKADAKPQAGFALPHA